MIHFFETVIVAVLLGWCWRLGGSDKPVWGVSPSKAYRLYWAPLILACHLGFYLRDFGWWQTPLAALTFFGIMQARLPITLIGDRLRPNYLWLLPLGWANFAFLAPLALISHWKAGLVLTFVFGLLYALNLVVFEEYRLATGKDRWYIQERATGALLALAPYILSILT